MTAKPDDPGLIRTRLANERTLLAYIRTSLAFLAGGVGMTQIFSGLAPRLLGWILLGAGLAVLSAGIFRFIAVTRRISRLDGRS